MSLETAGTQGLARSWAELRCRRCAEELRHELPHGPDRHSPPPDAVTRALRLLKHDQSAPLGLIVGWCADAAEADDGEIDVRLGLDGKQVVVEGWMSNCGTELDIISLEEEEDPS